MQVLRIGHFISCHQPWTNGTKGIGTLSLYPLSCSFKLKCALREVVDDTIARDVRERIFHVDVLCLFTDYDSEFNFPIDLLRVARNHHVIVRSADRRGRFHKYHRFRRNSHARLSSMIGIVESDADEFPYSTDARTQPRRARDERQARRIQLTQFLQ